jgi:two-component system chemotaxis response regulator CheB
MTRILGAVAIGASAGGVDALGQLLPALPAAFPAPVLVVVHLPPRRPSLLAEIFALRCALPVREAEDKLPAVAGTVWFAPPDYHLLVDRGPQLALSADPPVHWSRPSIDALFESAADVWRESLVAVVLTGGNEDGAAGAVAVQRAGGRVVVQDPVEAAAPAMPRAALERCPDATVLPLAGIAALLAGLTAE